MKAFFTRFFDLFIGNVLFAFGIVGMIKANIGYAPWEVFHVGIANTIGLGLGVTSIIVGSFIVIIVTALGEKFGFGTIACMVMTGAFVDIILFADFVPKLENLVGGIVLLIAGLFTISVGSYFYLRSAFGSGPRDSLMVVLARKTKMPVGACRSIVELTATLIGWRLGGMIGIGTVVSVVMIGFCIQITFWALKFDVKAVKHETFADTYRSISVKRPE